MDSLSSNNTDSFKNASLNLLKSQHSLTLSFILQCQKKCLTFESSDVSQPELNCLTKCADEYVFFDNTTYELDSATVMATQ